MGEPAREGARHGRPRRAGASCVDRGPLRADERGAGGPATARQQGSPASAGGSARRGGGRLDELDEYPTGVLGVNEVDPVSYTHLRAHETDSYLVCRLLLE